MSFFFCIFLSFFFCISLSFSFCIYLSLFFLSPFIYLLLSLSLSRTLSFRKHSIFRLFPSLSLSNYFYVYFFLLNSTHAFLSKVSLFLYSRFYLSLNSTKILKLKLFIYIARSLCLGGDVPQSLHFALSEFGNFKREWGID